MGGLSKNQKKPKQSFIGEKKDKIEHRQTKVKIKEPSMELLMWKEEETS